MNNFLLLALNIFSIGKMYYKNVFLERLSFLSILLETALRIITIVKIYIQTLAVEKVIRQPCNVIGESDKNTS